MINSNALKTFREFANARTCSENPFAHEGHCRDVELLRHYLLICLDELESKEYLGEIWIGEAAVGNILNGETITKRKVKAWIEKC